MAVSKEIQRGVLRRNTEGGPRKRYREGGPRKRYIERVFRRNKERGPQKLLFCLLQMFVLVSCPHTSFQSGNKWAGFCRPQVKKESSETRVSFPLGWNVWSHIHRQRTLSRKVHFCSHNTCFRFLEGYMEIGFALGS